MIPNAVFEQMAGAGLDVAQVIVVTKMLMVTAEAARTQAREEMREEMAEMRSQFGRLIIEAVAATEERIFARLEKERERQEAMSQERRERAAARKRERERERERQAQEMAGALQEGSEQGLQGALDLGGAGVANGATTANGVEDVSIEARDVGVEPVTVKLAAKFGENSDYAKLMAEWEEKARLNSGGATTAGGAGVTKSAPLGAMKSLGEAMLAGLRREMEAEGMMPVDRGDLLEAAA